MEALRPVKTLKTMDSSEKISKPTDEDSSERCSEGEPGNRTTNACNILQPLWVRCAFRPNHEVDGFLLDYGCYLLLPIGTLLWTILLMA
jgi:hypothetical protein